MNILVEWMDSAGLKGEAIIQEARIAPERHDIIASTLPPELLDQAAQVALCFRPKGVAPD